jgi:hypothetical protein
MLGNDHDNHDKGAEFSSYMFLTRIKKLTHGFPYGPTQRKRERCVQRSETIQQLRKKGRRVIDEALRPEVVFAEKRQGMSQIHVTFMQV